MNDYKDQKELKIAMNGRMGLMTGGIILIITAVTSTLMYGINLFSIASGAAGGNQEYLDVISQAGMEISTVRIISVCFFALACLEIYSGIFCAMRCNRLDKVKGTKIVAIVTLVAEIVVQLALFLTHMLNLGSLLLAVVVPAYMIWGATRLEKLAKLYPDRKIALNTKKAKDARGGANSSKPSSAQPAQKKSLRERAMMNAELPEEDTSEDVDTTLTVEETPDIEASAEEASAEAASTETNHADTAEADAAEAENDNTKTASTEH